MLTAKQEQFVQNIVAGMTQVEAYRQAYNTERMSEKTAHEKACILAKSDKIRTRLQELRDRIASDSIMTAQKRLEWLTAVVNGDEDINAKLKAVDIMNRMQGEYTQKIEAEVTKEVTINIELSDDE
jgi:phage terminase small subunit